MKRVTLTLACLLCAATAAADMSAQQFQDHMAAESVKSAILTLAKQDHGDELSGLLIALGLMKSPQADQALVDLSDYYFGESVGEDTNSVITHRGPVLLPLLRAHLLKPPKCEPGLKCLTREERDGQIRLWIDSLEKTEVIEFNQ
jgi:hypothetical protein